MIAPTLTTERITIAPMTLDHFEAHAAAWADPEMTRFIGGKPRSRNESWGKFVQGAGLWSIVGYGFFVRFWPGLAVPISAMAGLRSSIAGFPSWKALSKPAGRSHPLRGARAMRPRRWLLSSVEPMRKSWTKSAASSTLATPHRTKLRAN